MRTTVRTARMIGAAILSVALAAVALRAQLPQAVLDQDAHMAQLAAEAAARGPITPIPLLGENGRMLGAVYDQFLVGALIARAEMPAGNASPASAILAHPSWQARAIVIVAYPVNCDGQPNHPLAIRWTTSASLPVAPTPLGDPLRGAAGQSQLPGVGLPDDALVVSVRNAPMFGSAVEIDYANPVCHGGAKTASLPVATTPSREISTAFNGVKLPDALASLPSPSTVRVQVVLDGTGRARFPAQVQGPEELGPAAIEALTSRTFPPATINGVAMPLNMMVTFVFTATGAPAQAAPFAMGAPPGVMTATSSMTVAVPSAPTAPSLPPVPPAPPGQTNAQLARLAIEIAKAGDPTPVPLDPAGPAVHGVVFDAFLVTAVKARALEKAGTPIDPAAAAASFLQEGLVAVAYPLTCDGRTITPTEIGAAIGGTRPGPLRETGSVLVGAALADRLPGVALPAGAVGRAFANSSFAQNVEVRITYAEAPCGTRSQTLTLPVQWVRGQSEPHASTFKLPAGSSLPSPTYVRVRGVVDPSGAYRFPTIADGPAELGPTAMVTTAQWRFQPYRANGVGSPQVVITTLAFTATGMPEPPGAPTSGPPASTNSPGLGNEPRVLANTTVGGRPPEFTTPDAPGLSAATSKCDISTDAGYAFTPGAPIKVGGGPAQGPARERQYLSALRGPAGQGLAMVRRGSLLSPDGQTILDLYEITYAGLPTPLRLYLDEYHEEPLKAPQGLACAVAIVVR